MKRNHCLIFSFCLILIGLIGFSTVTYAGDEGQVRASAPASVGVGQQFRLTFTSSEEISELRLPSMSAFTILGGPSTSHQSSYQIINGKTSMSNSYSYTYFLQADKEGDWEIPSITVKAGGKSYRTNPVSIRVSKGNSSSGSQGGGGYGSGGSGGSGSGSSANSGNSQSGSGSFNKNDIFIKAELSKTNPYVEEEVVLHYKLYVGPEANRFQADVSKLPSFTGFWTYELARTVERRPYKENLNGKTYSVVDLYDVAVYPQKSGKLTISPLEVEMIVQVVVRQAPSNDPWANFFNNSFFGGNLQNIELKVESKPVTINVKELPATNCPADFSGLVGNFSMKSELSRNELKSNDATNFTITISGKGNLQHVEAPQVTFPSDIDAHDPGVFDNVQKDVKGGISGSRKFDYILIPREAGDFDIPQVQFIYFDPVKKQYVTLSSNPYTLKVSKGEASAQTAVVAGKKKDVKELGRDIRFIRTDNPNLRSGRQRSFFLSPLYFVSVSLPLVLFVLFLLLLGKRIKDQRNAVMLKDKRASKVARKRLKTAAQYLKSGDNTRFYEEISRVLWGYVGDKFHLPKGELSLDSARQKLEERHMAPERIDEFVETLNQCEFARFAPVSDMTPEKMYGKTFSFITNLEAELVHSFNVGTDRA